MYRWKNTPEPASDTTGGHSRTVDELFNDLHPPSPETSVEDLSLSSITFDTINESDARVKIFVRLSIKLILKHEAIYCLCLFSSHLLSSSELLQPTKIRN